MEKLQKKQGETDRLTADFSEHRFGHGVGAKKVLSQQFWRRRDLVAESFVLG